METAFVIRKAQPGDEAAIMGLVQELADYEKEPDAVINTPEQLRIDLFEDRICHCLVVEKEDGLCAMALYYISYSTWNGRCLYLEDLYVQPHYRRHGIGRALFEELIALATKNGYRRMDWQVLDWNDSAIAFYKKIDAHLDPEWVNGRLFFGG